MRQVNRTFTGFVSRSSSIFLSVIAASGVARAQSLTYEKIYVEGDASPSPLSGTQLSRAGTVYTLDIDSSGRVSYLSRILPTSATEVVLCQIVATPTAATIYRRSDLDARTLFSCVCSSELDECRQGYARPALVSEGLIATGVGLSAVVLDEFGHIVSSCPNGGILFGSPGFGWTNLYEGVSASFECFSSEIVTGQFYPTYSIGNSNNPPRAKYRGSELLVQDGEMAHDQNDPGVLISGSGWDSRVNAQGVCVFTIPLRDDSSPPVPVGEVLYRGVPGALSILAKKGEVAPEASGRTFKTVYPTDSNFPPSITDDATVVFSAFLNDGNQGIWIYDPSASPERVAILGDPVAGMTGWTWFDFVGPQLLINNNSTVAFQAVIRNTTNTNWTRPGIFTWTPTVSGSPGKATLVAEREGPAYAVNGTECGGEFIDFGEMALDDDGNVAFVGKAFHDINAEDEVKGIWYGKVVPSTGERRYNLVARVGQVIGSGGTAKEILSIDFNQAGLGNSGSINDGGYNAMNNEHQLCFSATVREPGTTAVFDAIYRISGLADLPSATPCAADFNNDGFANGDDYDAFVAAFEAGDLLADFDCDLFVSGDDFDAFNAAFTAGCD